SGFFFKDTARDRLYGPVAVCACPAYTLCAPGVEACASRSPVRNKKGAAMSMKPPVYIGTDGGATTSKIGGVWSDGTTVSTSLLQRPTNAHLGPEAVVRGWVESITLYLEQNELTWDQVQGVGVAIPGPRRSYGVLERGPNLPESFVGFDVYTAYSRA